MAIRNIIQKAEQEYPPSLKQEVDPIASGLLTGKADLVHTHTATQISDSTAAGRTLLTSNLANQRTHLAFFPTFSGRSFFPVNGDVNRVYTALDTSKIYTWISLLNDYVEISPTPTGELDTRYARITNVVFTTGTQTISGNKTFEADEYIFSGTDIFVTGNGTLSVDQQTQTKGIVKDMGGASGIQVMTTGAYNSGTPLSGVVYILI